MYINIVQKDMNKFQVATVIFVKLTEVSDFGTTDFFINSLKLSENLDHCLVQQNGSCRWNGTFFKDHNQ